MTDNEIVKALECCSTYSGSCEKCPAFVKVDRSNCNKVLVGALDIINRQKAEIEKNENIIRLADKTIEAQNAEIERLNKEVDRLSQLVLYHDGDVADAIKEFAERLKADCPAELLVIHFDAIDNLVKEMAGDA